jgi:hypothetical protein
MITILVFSIMIIVLTMIAVSAWIVNYLLIKLPEQQRNIINQFVPCVVAQVSSLDVIQQRKIAAEKMRDIFIEFGIPNPGNTIIEASIIYAINQRKIKESDMWIEELKLDQMAQAQTGEMPTTPKELVL